MPNTTDEPLNGLSLNAERNLSDEGLRPLADLMDLLGIGHRVEGMPSFAAPIRSSDLRRQSWFH
jgi:hypothetical protein